MIHSIQIQNFKAFKDLTVFPLAKINLLTGINGRGKSSFLQMLLLFKQSIDADGEQLQRLILNGSCVQLGTYSAIRNYNVSQTVPITITFSENENDITTVNLEPSRDDDMVVHLSQRIPTALAGQLNKVHYVAADRIGPQLFYKRLPLSRFITVGTRGENVGNVLFQKRDLLVLDSLYLGGNKSQELLIQIGEWIGFVLDAEDFRVNVRDVGNSVIILSFQFGNNETELMPSNVGFGYTYVLPIILSGLIARPGEILIIENPEAHLHPKAQSKLVEFLSIIAALGVQVLIESHSEHILNALRIQVAIDDLPLVNNDVSVLYFQDNSSQEKVKKIDIQDDGNIEVWPENFFDQNRKDLKTLLKL